MDKRRFAQISIVVLCLAVAAPGRAVADQVIHPLPLRVARLRRPVAAVFLAGGKTLCVANHHSGSVSLVDVPEGRVRDEWAVGERLAGLAALPDGRHFLVVDELRHELVALLFDGSRLTVQARLPVQPYPVSVVVQPDGMRATVACLWSRQLQVVNLTPLVSSADAVTLHIACTIRLPFAPRTQCALPGSSVAVADAFGGRLAIVDVAGGRLRAIHNLACHNLRGLAVDREGKELLLCCQLLNQRAATTQVNIERGVLMDNVVRTLPLDGLLTPGFDVEASGRLLRLGAPGAGAGDPAGLAVLDAKQLAVALAGVNDVALVGADGQTVWRVAVGRRPTAVLPGQAEQPLVVINTFDDSLTLVDIRRGKVTRSITLGPRSELGPQERGELLFFDARLARDGWLSCHSCHSDGHTNGLLADTLGDNTYGTPKRTLTLRNTALTDPWAWNGEMKYLHDQVRQSLGQTMHAGSVTEEQVNDLVSFLHTLPPPPPAEPVTADEADRRRVERGRSVFQQRGCVHCHIPPLTYSSHETYDVGFADERGQRKFNPPSLRGVSQGYRFFHDNRAATLEEVFTKFHHKVGEGIATEDLADLLRFLRSL
jgi:cytochrome c peroxidase